MGSNRIIIKCSCVSETSAQKLETIFDKKESGYFFNSSCSSSEAITEISMEVSWAFQEDEDLVLPLFMFVAAHCEFSPVLRIHYSSDGEAFFLVSEENKLVWKDLATEALEGYVIYFSGEGSWMEEEDLERAGGKISETYSSEVNLLEFGVGGDESLLEKAKSTSVKVVSPKELEDMYEGWGRLSFTSVIPSVPEDDQNEIKAIKTTEQFVEWLSNYDGRFE